jgi:hypothetical protein
MAGYTGLDTATYLSIFLENMNQALRVKLIHYSGRGLPSLMEVSPTRATQFRRRVLPCHLEARIVAARTKEEAKKRYLEAYLTELLATVLIPLSYPHCPKALRPSPAGNEASPTIDDMIKSLIESQD